MPTAQPKWKIELRASTWPVEEWMELRRGYRRAYRFVDRFQADEAVKALQRVQPHLVLRIVPIAG